MGSLQQILALLQLIESLTPRLVAIIAAIKAEKGMTNADLRAQAKTWNAADRDAFDAILDHPDLED